jgi:hypothetical protein
MPSTGDRHAIGINPRQTKFVEHVVSGDSQADAYRKAYGKRHYTALAAAQAAHKVANRPAVKQRLQQLMQRSEGSMLLSLNQRLSILAKNAKAKCRTAADRNACARTIEVYNKTAGDGAPERQEVIVKNEPGEAFATVTRTMTKAEKLAGMRANRAPGKQEPLPPVPTP